MLQYDVATFLAAVRCIPPAWGKMGIHEDKKWTISCAKRNSWPATLGEMSYLSKCGIQ